MVSGKAERRCTCRGLAPWQVALAMELFSKESCAGYSVEEVAARCGLSRSYFEKAFKVSLGMSPHRLQMQQRVRLAGAMLEQTSDSGGSIALNCGFADQSHLTRVFHSTVGSSPAAWRRQRKAGVAPPLVPLLPSSNQ